MPSTEPNDSKRSDLMLSRMFRRLRGFLRQHRVSALYMITGLKISGGFVRQAVTHSGELRAGAATASATSLLVSGFLARLVAIWREATTRRRHGLGEADGEASLGDDVPTPSLCRSNVG